jgi:single-strand DNA-binding protein
MMNSVNVIGNLVTDPELKKINDDLSLCKFRIAVNEGFGENAKVFFFEVVSWNKQAENIAKYMVKGNKIAVSGSLQQESWENKDGDKRSKTVIRAFNVEFLSPPKGKNENSNTSPKKAANKAVEKNDDEDEGDLPF